ncbi:helix-turn-helix domain-containing protein [Gynuella sp.]|uniref:helix-turn-helix transcriptional regulator n=1 Tax=Gynuella sp. TaxID=2969146 RepID=UPI003D10E536
MNPALLWTLRIFIYATLIQALLRMYTAGVTVIWAWSIGAIVFALLLPIGQWKKRWSPYMIMAVLIVEGIFAMIGMLLTPVPGVLQFAFFILLTLSAQLPRPLSILSYLLLLLMNHLPFVLVSNGQANVDFIFDLLPGQLVFIAFSEIFWQSRRIIEENRKLIDELVEAQRELHPEHKPSAEAVVFSKRDKEVLALIAKGFSNKEIAERLFLAEGTVKNRVSMILEKTGVRNRTEAALKAREIGVL